MPQLEVGACALETGLPSTKRSTCSKVTETGLLAAHTSPAVAPRFVPYALLTL